MKLLLTVVALLASLNAMADAGVLSHDVFSHSDCQRLSPSERARVQAITSCPACGERFENLKIIPHVCRSCEVAV